MPPHEDGTDDLASLRATIDELDASLVALLARRRGVVDRIRALKAARGDPPRDPAREEALLEARAALGAAAGLDPQAVRALFDAVLRASRE